MQNNQSMRNVVLCFSGLDPSGGAGLQADIEAIGACGAHAAIACTAVTVQSSQQVFDFDVCPADLVTAQAQAILDDLPVTAIKSGMLGSTSTITKLVELFKQKKIKASTPYILDPVLVANSGNSLGDTQALATAFSDLLPYATIITPNTHELRALSGEQNLHEGAKKLCKQGINAVLVKTSHDHTTGDIDQFLYIKTDKKPELIHHSVIKRLDGEFHGSGCSFASYIAGQLAQLDYQQSSADGTYKSEQCIQKLISAVKAADKWIHKTLINADRPHPNDNAAQLIPNRFIT